jgi:hypothetical protein
VGRRNGDQRGHWAVASSVPQSGRRHGLPHYHHTAVDSRHVEVERAAAGNYLTRRADWPARNGAGRRCDGTSVVAPSGPPSGRRHGVCAARGSADAVEDALPHSEARDQEAAKRRTSDVPSGRDAGAACIGEVSFSQRFGDAQDGGDMPRLRGPKRSTRWRKCSDGVLV